MTVVTVSEPQSFETVAGTVTVTGVDTAGPVERCVKGYIRRTDDPRITDALEYNLNGVVQAGRWELNLDLREARAASLMKLFTERRLRS